MNSVFDGFHHLPMRLHSDKSQKNWRQKIPFLLLSAFFAHISGHECDKCIRSLVFCIIYRCAYSHVYEVSVGVIINNARFRCLRQTSISRQENFFIQVAVLVRSLCFLFFFSFFLPALGVNEITLVPVY